MSSPGYINKTNRLSYFGESQVTSICDWMFTMKVKFWQWHHWRPWWWTGRKILVDFVYSWNRLKIMLSYLLVAFSVSVGSSSCPGNTTQVWTRIHCACSPLPLPPITLPHAATFVYGLFGWNELTRPHSLIIPLRGSKRPAIALYCARRVCLLTVPNVSISLRHCPPPFPSFKPNPNLIFFLKIIIFKGWFLYGAVRVLESVWRFAAASRGHRPCARDWKRGMVS